MTSSSIIQVPCPDCGAYGCRKGYSFSVQQGGITVASGSATKADDAIRECNRYAIAYLADGRVKYVVRHGRKVVGRASLMREPADVGFPPKAEGEQ